MHRTVSDTAVRLFPERGFDAVSVAGVAAAAEISEPVIFRYFPAKEDLVLYRIADHEAARGPVPAEAPRRHFPDGLRRCGPVTGLDDDPEVPAFRTLLHATPALVARLYGYLERSEAAPAGAPGGGLDARPAAGRIIAVRRILAQEDRRRIAAGERIEDVRGTRWRRPSGPSGRRTGHCRDSGTE